jgi:RNA-directed DNA polymerase
MEKKEKDHIHLQTIVERFLRIKNLDELTGLLKTDIHRFNYHLNKPLYMKFSIPKKRNGKREITAPNEDLKLIQKRLNYFLQHIYYTLKPDCVHGFVNTPIGEEKVSSIVSNAMPHVGKRYLLNIDLKDFFDTITAKRVKQVLFSQLELNANEVLVNGIVLLSTYKGKLPTGAPTSPVMANMVCLGLDYDLLRFCEAKGITYTRYADDLSFSSDNYFSEEHTSEIRSLVGKHEFVINEKKFRLLSSKSKQTVTGLIVNKKLNLDRIYIRQLRAVLHDITLRGWIAATSKHFNLTVTSMDDVWKLKYKLKGQIDFVGQVKGKGDGIYLRLKTNYESLNLLNKF